MICCSVSTRSENWKAKNNIKKARLALWWEAVMTMVERERTVRCVCGGVKTKREGTDSLLRTACVSGIGPGMGDAGMEQSPRNAALQLVQTRRTRGPRCKSYFEIIDLPASYPLRSDDSSSTARKQTWNRYLWAISVFVDSSLTALLVMSRL